MVSIEFLLKKSRF